MWSFPFNGRECFVVVGAFMVLGTNPEPLQSQIRFESGGNGPDHVFYEGRVVKHPHGDRTLIGPFQKSVDGTSSRLLDDFDWILNPYKIEVSSFVSTRSNTNVDEPSLAMCPVSASMPACSAGPTTGS